MSEWVVDASVAAKWFVAEPHSDAARRLLDCGDALHAPDYFLLELDSTVSKWVRRSLISTLEARITRSEFSNLPVKLYPFADLRGEAFEIALETKSSSYDCLYLALSIRLAAPMITADRRFFDNIAAGRLRSHVRWVGDLA